MTGSIATIEMGAGKVAAIVRATMAFSSVFVVTNSLRLRNFRATA